MIALLPFTADDIPRLAGWLPTPESMMFWTAHMFEFPLDHGRFRQHLADSAAQGNRSILKAVDPDSGEMIGFFELYVLDAVSRSARIGRVLVDPSRRGQGVGGEMMRAALRLAFEEWGMHRVELGVFDTNPRAMAVYEKVGFRRDGARRESFLGTGGEYWSEVVMSVLAPEWAG